jgi:tRNA modification GTPase
MRHRDLVSRAADALADFRSGDSSMPELRAEDLRRAAHALGRITGRVDVDDVLGRIFSAFCIGK